MYGEEARGNNVSPKEVIHTCEIGKEDSFGKDSLSNP